jgi:cell wall assembly regulator SMI1
MRSTVDALRAVGCTVSARFEKPAAAAASKALAAAFEGIVPPSLAAIFSRFDGFDVQWERDDVAVTCTWMGARDVVSAWRAEQKLVASLASEDGGDPGLAARRTIVPLIAQYDGGLVGLDVARAARGEMPVVFLDRLADASKVIASSAGHLLEALVHGAFTHPGIPDVAHRKALPIAKALARRR